MTRKELEKGIEKIDPTDLVNIARARNGIPLLPKTRKLANLVLELAMLVLFFCALSIAVWLVVTS